MKLLFTLLMISTLISTISHGEAKEETKEEVKEQAGESGDQVKDSEIGVRLDCLHDFNIDKGSSQPCISVSGLRFKHKHAVSSTLRAMVRLDPFGSVSESKERTSLRKSDDPTVRDTDFTLVDDYAVIWTPRPNLEVAIEEYGGAAKIPSTSGLSLASSFADRGWDQTAMSFTYFLSAFDGMEVKFVAGNGEGENGANLDAQQYFGFETDTTIIQGMNVTLGASFDGNNTGSSEYDWQWGKYVSECEIAAQTDEGAKQGFSTQRLAAGFMMDGSLPATKGFLVGVGYQRSVYRDLDKGTTSMPTATQLSSCQQLDIGSVLVEDSSGETVNTVQRTVMNINMAYQFFETYFIGFDFENMIVDTGSVDLFETCSGFAGYSCSGAVQNRTNSLSQTAYTVGGGKEISEGLMLTIEYNKTYFDNFYNKFYYRGTNEKGTDTMEVFNARIAYSWQ